MKRVRPLHEGIDETGCDLLEDRPDQLFKNLG
jgi:hypothetical protein